MEAAAYLEFVISATASFYCSDNSNIFPIDATKSDMMKAPHRAFTTDTILPKGETAATSP